MTRRFFLACAALLAIAGWAAPPALAQSADRGAAGAKFIQDLGQRAIGVLTQQNVSRDEIRREFRAILQEGFDVPYIGRFVLGRYWQQATPQQQQEYLQLVERMIVDIYADRFAQYAGQDLAVDQNLKILGTRAEGETDTIVSSQIVPANAPPVAVDWRVRDRDGRRKVIDVAVENVSMSVTQRNEFASVIQRGGGQVEALLQALRQRVRAG
ncbi:MlaC/ttg2D family ABC transporter substrate-binding protein [Arenibaculum pallidiluteum]|uniref:MlaC/ttg2D family ABC transporter substrate-binding protein n=1 Tax=Arenibaculum pallidiluteum TaxID=2812559 RepID=UPI001A971EB2|nr:ABC transporter substrate-binding protein [Arenibaculum pallidiluteum]